MEFFNSKWFSTKKQLMRRKKREFRRVYDDDAQITVKCTWLFNNMVYLDPFEVHSIEHFYTRKYVCALLPLYDLSLLLCAGIFWWIWLPFYQKIAAKQKSWYILVNTPTIEKISVYFSWQRKTIYCLSLCKHVLFLQFLFSQLVDFFTRDALKS